MQRSSYNRLFIKLSLSGDAMGTGPWHDVEELYTNIKVTTDTSDLDQIINMDWGDAEINQIMSPLVKRAKKYKSQIEKGAEKGVKELADRDRSLQELALALHGNIFSGKLIQNIKVKEISKREYNIGPNVAHFYPLCIEFGRGPVYPIRFGFLHWTTLGGEEVYAKKAGPSEPYPFVKPAFEDIDREAESVIMRCIGDVANR